MAEFDFDITYGTPVRRSPRVRKAQFGDGYQQRVGDGINKTPRLWSIRVEGLQGDVEPVEAFLNARAGVESFDWTPPTESAGVFLCSSWTVTAEDFGQWILNAEFEEVFGE